MTRQDDSDPIDRTGLRPEFWRRYPLDELPRREWEALCDGCAKCCLVKLEDEDSGEVHYTNISCRLLDTGACRCGNYPLRRQLVAGCVVLTRDNMEEVLQWMPHTCAYRLVFDGHDLEPWHPLISGDRNSVARAGKSLPAKTVPEYEVDEDDWEDHVIEDFG
ncbi:YcgN family cysteine cluster protein [Amaricoccus tamworthensis]|uniref:YcgN family cysteine cluster protein n=1 Tax=Amaricoccus tamworthensis TaxID=57002 RepID=UPI003C7C67E7